MNTLKLLVALIILTSIFSCDKKPEYHRVNIKYEMTDDVSPVFIYFEPDVEGETGISDWKFDGNLIWRSEEKIRYCFLGRRAYKSQF